MRIFSLIGSQVVETAHLDQLSLPIHNAGRPGFVWLACARPEFEAMQANIQAGLQRLCGVQLVDLHISDLLNNSLPSRYDHTSEYDLLVFRRLATAQPTAPVVEASREKSPNGKRAGPPILNRIDTSPVGFAVFDQVLLTVHPADCSVRDSFAARLLAGSGKDLRVSGARSPSSPADLMLRILNQMVDGFLDLRRELTHQLDHWQSELIRPETRFNNWRALLDARLALHKLDEIGEDQRACVQDWIESVKTWPDATTPAEQRERDLLEVRSRDVLEHIERVVHHVRRLEQSTETAVQMHFSVQGSRTNDIMRVLTVLTAIFLPLNLITGFFGMNFDALPLIHRQTGLWWAISLMTLVGVALAALFWRKRYLAQSGR